MHRKISTLINTNGPRATICRNAKAFQPFCKNEKGDTAAYPETGLAKSSPCVDLKMCRRAPPYPEETRQAVPVYNL